MCILRWEVEHAIHVVLVVTESGRVTLKDFTSHVYSSSLFELRIECLLNRLGRVNSKTIDWKLLAVIRALDIWMTYWCGLIQAV
jgi:hypothetical protein